MMYLVVIFFVQVSYTAGESRFACRPSVIRPGNGLPYYETQPYEKPFNEAEEHCREMGAELLSIRKHQTPILTELPRKWLSAKRRNWTHVDLDLALTYDTGLNSPWEGYAVAVINSDQLAARPSSELHQIVCMKKDLGYCMGRIYDNWCYFIPESVNDNKTHVNHSSYLCQTQTSVLVAIRNPNQIRWISETFNIPSFWTGYHYNASSTEYYWHDGSRVVNASWNLPHKKTGDCVILNENGQLEKSDCSTKELYTCALDVPYDTVATTCWNYTDECVCFWAGDGKVTFHQAMALCLSSGGTLSYRNTSEVLQQLNVSYNDLWLGISDAHTPGVFRGTGELDTKRVSLPNLSQFGGCIKGFPYTSVDCLDKHNFVCQSTPEEPSSTCDRSATCLRTSGQWHVEDPPFSFNGAPDLVIQNVGSVEICWDFCVVYIAFECLAITYNPENHECGLRTTIPTASNSSKSYSRNRTRHVEYPNHLEKLDNSATNKEALQECYERGGEIPVIRDRTMLEKLANMTDRGNRTWISAMSTGDVLPAFRTLYGEYISYSNWAPNDTYDRQRSCVVIDENSYWKMEDCSSRNNVVCVLPDMCYDMPDIYNGGHTYDVYSGMVKYECHRGYYMPTLNVTHVDIQCNGRSYGDMTPVENCTAHLKKNHKNFPKISEPGAKASTNRLDGNDTHSNITCPEPDRVANAVQVIHGTGFGDNVTYTCQENYRITGLNTTSANATCRYDVDFKGIWLNVPSCEVQPTCPEPPEVANSEVSVSGFNPGDVAFYTCDPGYMIIHDNSTEWMSTTWQSVCKLDPEYGTALYWDSIPKCGDIPYDQHAARQCPSLDDIVGAKLIYHDRFIDSEATYIVSVHYVFQNGGNSRTTICQAGGQWSAKSPNLKRKTCPELAVVGATLSTANHQSGSEIEVRCRNPTAKLENGLRRMITRCTGSGRWRYIPRYCKADRCGPFEFVEHASMVEYNNSVGGLAVLECHNSYRFADGSRKKSFKCLNTTLWEPTEHCFIAVCPKLRKPVMGSISTELALENTVVDIKCLPGYMFADRTQTKQVTCDSTFNWTAQVEECQVITCPEPPKITNGVMTSSNVSYDSTIIYRCSEGYRMENGQIEATIRCAEGANWNQTSLSCDVGRCPPVPDVKNSTSDTSLAVNGTTVLYTCYEGYIFPHNSTVMSISCDGRAWNVTDTACSEVTCPILNLKHATWSDDGRNFGDAVTIICDEGYQYNNKTTGILKCQGNSQWNGDTTGCRPINCGSLPEVLYAIHNIPEDNYPGTMVTYRCLDGYWFRRQVVQTTIICSSSGSWSYVPSQCRPITCPAVPVWPDKMANTTETSVGTVVNVISTKDADVGSTLFVSYCLRNGEWDPVLDEVYAFFEPEPEEAQYSESIGIISVTCIGIVIAAVVISDVGKIIVNVQKRKKPFC